MEDCIKRIKELEPLFSDNQYRGSGKTAFSIEEGQIPVMISAPHAVKQFREGMIKQADIYTGGIARYLHEVTGCHLIYSCMFTESDPNYDIPGRNQYQDALLEYISRHRVVVLLDLHGAGKEREYAVEIGTVPRQDSVSGIVYETDINHIVELGVNNKGGTDRRSFEFRLAEYVFEYMYKDSEISGDIVGAADISEDNLLAEVAQELNLPLLVIAINQRYLKAGDGKLFALMFGALTRIVSMLSSMDWSSDNYDVFRVWQANAKSQIPQDKIEITGDCESRFKENSFLHICSFYGIHETVRVHRAAESSVKELDDYLTSGTSGGQSEEYVILTNRLIETLFGREWFENDEALPGLRGIPVIVYESGCEEYEIGIPKANQVNDITLSTELYKEKLPLAARYDYLLFNRFTDSRIHIKIEKSDYQDNGRVKSKDGTLNVKKVMLPRYYRLMMGYLERPLRTIRAEDTDDKNSVARLNSNMMSLIGVSENDKLLIRFGENVITLRVLANDDLTDYEIGIPASGRRNLGMNSINDIVIVHRDMAHTFKRHSQEQTIAILGTVLAVVQVITGFDIFTKSVTGIAVAVAVCVISILLILYFVLSEERVKVK